MMFKQYVAVKNMLINIFNFFKLFNYQTVYSNTKYDTLIKKIQYTNKQSLLPK